MPAKKKTKTEHPGTLPPAPPPPSAPPPPPPAVEEEDDDGGYPKSAERPGGTPHTPAPPKPKPSRFPLGRVAIFTCADKHDTKGSAASSTVLCWKPGCGKQAKKYQEYDEPWDGKPR